MSSASLRVCRGGSWYYSAVYARAASRSWYDPGGRDFNLGFRCAMMTVVVTPIANYSTGYNQTSHNHHNHESESMMSANTLTPANAAARVVDDALASPTILTATRTRTRNRAPRDPNTHRKGRNALDYKLFEVTRDMSGKRILTEMVTPVTNASGSTAIMRAIRDGLAKADPAFDIYANKELVVAGMVDSVTVKVEIRRTVKFEQV